MKYDRLAEHLRQRKNGRWSATFDEIERVIGFRLPNSARRYPAWWANQTGQGHSQNQAWMGVGWRTSSLDLAGESIVFLRVDGSDNHLRAGRRSANDNEQALFDQAREITGIVDRAELTRAGLTALIEREAAMTLARMGGSMPDFDAPPRQRGGS